MGLAFMLLRRFGLAGATMGFVGLYVWHGILVYVVVRRLSGFRWSAANLRTGLFFLPLIGVVFVNFLALPLWVATTFGVVAALASGIYSLRAVCRLVSLERAPRLVQHVLVWFRISRMPAMPPVLDGPSSV